MSDGIQKLLTRFMFGESVANDPLQRWSLIDPSKESFRINSCVFTGYHYLRSRLKASNQFFEFHQTQIPSSLMRRNWIVFAEAVAAEANELSCPCKKFSITEFLDLLIRQSSDLSITAGQQQAQLTRD